MSFSKKDLLYYLIVLTGVFALVFGFASDKLGVEQVQSLVNLGMGEFEAKWTVALITVGAMVLLPKCIAIANKFLNPSSVYFLLCEYYLLIFVWTFAIMRLLPDHIVYSIIDIDRIMMLLGIGEFKAKLCAEALCSIMMALWYPCAIDLARGLRSLANKRAFSFFVKSIKPALMGKLLIQCYRCEERIEIESSPDTLLPRCHHHGETDWRYSKVAIAILRLKGRA